MKSPKVAIHIPIYNQPDKLRVCLDSIAQQTFLPDEVVLFDDCSSKSYESVLSNFKDLNIKYKRNSKNLGAVPNMLYSLYYQTDADYVNVFHEDDIMHPRFIETSIEALEKNPDSVYTYSLISFFDNYKNIYIRNIDKKHMVIEDKSKLVQLFLEGKTLGFGTVFYRKKLLKKVNFDFNKFSVFGDRPFLIELSGINPIVVIFENIVYAYLSLDNDTRWDSLQVKHIFNLYKYYKSFKSSYFPKNDRKIFSSGITYGILYSYKLLIDRNKINYILYLVSAYVKGLVNFKYLMLSLKGFRKFVESIK